jgi:hypothetical protein
MKIAEPSLVLKLYPVSVNDHVVVPSDAVMRATNVYGQFASICAPTPATAVVKLSVISGPA